MIYELSNNLKKKIFKGFDENIYLDGPFDGMSTPPVKQEEEGSFGDVGRIMQVSIYLSIYLSNYLSIHPSICLFTCILIFRYVT